MLPQNQRLKEGCWGSRYDAIIIGSGIGGSAIGVLLAHAGWKILILEKNNNEMSLLEIARDLGLPTSC